MPRLLKLIIFTSSIACLALAVFPVFAQVQNITGPCGFPGINCGGGETLAGNLIPLINVFINAALFLVGTASVIFLVYAGYKYISSRGDEQHSDQAKRQIVYAIIGIVVALSSWTIYQAVEDTGTSSGNGVTPIIDIANQFISAALLLVGTAAVIFLIYAGYRYISSRGDEQHADQAKRQIVYAIIGIVVVLGSSIIKDAIITTQTSGSPTVGVNAIIALITPYVNFALALAGVTAAIFLLYAGFKYIASRGQEDEMNQAKRQIVYAVSGLVLIGLAELIVAFVTGTAPAENLISEIITIIGNLISLIGIAAVIYVIIAGIQYMSAQGDEQAVSQAKRQLIYSLVGLVIVGLSVILTNFVITAIG